MRYKDFELINRTCKELLPVTTYNATRQTLEDVTKAKSNSLARRLDYRTPENRNASHPRPTMR
ncbi:MAG: hypothetical protein ACLUVG_08950 [Phocaeicola vulgatus]